MLACLVDTHFLTIHTFHILLIESVDLSKYSRHIYRSDDVVREPKKPAGNMSENHRSLNDKGR